MTLTKIIFRGRKFKFKIYRQLKLRHYFFFINFKNYEDIYVTRIFHNLENKISAKYSYEYFFSELCDARGYNNLQKMRPGGVV